MYTIICLGNTLLKDDGIGIVLGYLLKRKRINNKIYICETDIYFIEAALNSSKDIVIIDAVDIGIPEGETIILKLKDIEYSYMLPHEYVCNLKNKNGYLFGIQVRDISPAVGLSSELKNNINKYLFDIINLIKAPDE